GIRSIPVRTCDDVVAVAQRRHIQPYFVLGIAADEAVSLRDDATDAATAAGPGHCTQVAIPDGTSDEIVAVAQESEWSAVSGIIPHLVIIMAADEDAEQGSAQAVEQVHGARVQTAEIVRGVVDKDIAIAQDCHLTGKGIPRRGVRIGQIELREDAS